MIRRLKYTFFFYFVLRNIRLGATIDDLVRKEKYELPLEAIREMIINAYCHRNLLDVDYITSKFNFCLYGTNLKEDNVMMGFSIALIIIVLIVLYSLARTAGESDRAMEQIREQLLLGREESSGGNS